MPTIPYKIIDAVKISTEVGQANPTLCMWVLFDLWLLTPMWHYAQIYKSMQNNQLYAKVGYSIQKYAKVCKSMQKI